MNNTAPNMPLRIVQSIDKFFEMISKVCYALASVLLIFVTIIIFAGVINRGFIGFTWLFVEEYSALALIPMSYIAMGYTLRWNQHLKMDIVVRNVPDRLSQIFGIFASLFSFVCVCYMTIASTNWFIYTFERHVTSSGTLRTPLWIISATMVVGILLFAIDMGLLVIHRVTALITGKQLLRFIEDGDEEGKEEESLL